MGLLFKENKMKLYQVVILEVDKEEKPISILVEPETLLARDEQDAVVKITAKHSYELEYKEVKVLCRSF